jgi:hypothetical protein
MQRSNYRNINNFGNTPSNKFSSSVSNPLTYCINDTMSKGFLHGGNAYKYGQNSKECQAFLSDYCAQGWDGVCEFASKNNRKYDPNNLANANISGNIYNFEGLTSGDVLIRNTAAKKYLISLGNCIPRYEPFDPTVADSPMIQYWDSGEGQNNCIPLYAVDPKVIDDDIVMNKLLEKPTLAIDILINIYNNMKRMGMLDELNNTKIGKYFVSNPQIFR